MLDLGARIPAMPCCLITVKEFRMWIVEGSGVERSEV